MTSDDITAILVLARRDARLIVEAELGRQHVPPWQPTRDERALLESYENALLLASDSLREQTRRNIQEHQKRIAAAQK